MRAKHIDRTKWVRQIGSGMKGGCLPALFMAFVFIAHPRLLAAQDAQYEADAQYAQDGPIDESVVAATIATADADLENDQANADKAKEGDKADGTADSAQAGSDATSGDVANQAPSDSPDAAAGSASDQPSNGSADTALQASPALAPAASSANGVVATQSDANAQNPPQMTTAGAAPAPAPSGDVVVPSGPKSELALDTANLMKLANDLKSEVDKTSKDTLSITVVREADKIEQLARKMRTK